METRGQRRKSKSKGKMQKAKCKSENPCVPISFRPYNGIRPMTRSAIERAVLADPDARPLTAAGLKLMKRTPQAKIIRRALAVARDPERF